MVLTPWYRGGGEPNRLAPALTAADIIAYERDELGNTDIIVEDAVDLTAYPARRCHWLARRPAVAAEYGDVTLILLGDHMILARDGSGGCLVHVPQRAGFTI